MGLLATLVLAAASAGVESVSLTTVDSRQGVRPLVKLDRLEMSRGAGEPERVVLAEPPPARRPAPAPPPPETPDADPVVPKVEPPAATPVVVSEPAVEPVPAAPVAATTDTAELAKRLFPGAPAEPQATGSGSVSELYPRLFPAGAPEPPPDASEAPAEVIEPGQESGVPVGPFRIRASADARYVDADTFVEAQAEPTRDNYLEVQPRLAAVAPVGEGRFTLDYAPVFRVFATYDDVNSSSHSLGAALDLPTGPSVTLRARDRFRSGVLDTRVVDPGGEYFFGLGHFRRNDADAGLSVMVGPRLSVELGGAIGTVRFQEQSSFFDYDTRSAAAGFGYEITPNLKAIASYVWDRLPRPDERPEAESTAHSGRLTLAGDILPLTTGEVSVGYRNQSTPNAGLGGTGYAGLTLSAALTRQFGRESTLAFFANRSTPPSAYEQNGFYVSTGVQGTLQLPLPAAFQLRGGAGYQWNDYRTMASAIGTPREDRIFGWSVGLRRPVRPNLFLSATYRHEDRRSNVDTFDTEAESLYFQLEWDVFGTPPR